MGRQEKAGKLKVPCQVPPHPLGNRHCPQIARAFTNQVGVSSIEAYESRKSHGKIGDCEQSTAMIVEMHVDDLEITSDGGV